MPSQKMVKKKSIKVKHSFKVWKVRRRHRCHETRNEISQDLHKTNFSVKLFKNDYF